MTNISIVCYEPTNQNKTLDNCILKFPNPRGRKKITPYIYFSKNIDFKEYKSKTRGMIRGIVEAKKGGVIFIPLYSFDEFNKVINSLLDKYLIQRNYPNKIKNSQNKSNRLFNTNLIVKKQISINFKENIFNQKMPYSL